ncbi:hypothetical protein AMATHDRAFT_85978 [Amanita thiersii Skay4041]|uniref:Uncharacterized protein n=1 Tax=Amanita thiersii Skay4041 TaxID=703135 RepID=A0A2A9NJ99_9AGAR|nr:hypothetical protein AMATHDRAFT_85978 [Amanita thiersii Skay4041]
MVVKPTTGSSRGRSSVSKPLSTNADAISGDTAARDRSASGSPIPGSPDAIHFESPENKGLQTGDDQREEGDEDNNNHNRNSNPSGLAKNLMLRGSSISGNASDTSLSSDNEHETQTHPAASPMSTPPRDNTSPVAHSPDSDPDTDQTAFPAQPQPQASNSDSGSDFWLHMTTTLDACFDTSRNALDEHDAESEISDDLLADVPKIMQAFLSHGEICTKIEVEALDLATNGPGEQDEDEPLKVYTDMLDVLDYLQQKAVSLESTITQLTNLPSDPNPATDKDEDESENSDDETTTTTYTHPHAQTHPTTIHTYPAAHAELRRIFAACLPVLRARIANLTMAQDLIDSAQENLSISLRMESLGID